MLHDIVWPKKTVDTVQHNRGLKLLATEKVYITVAGVVTEMAGNRTRRNQLHRRNAADVFRPRLQILNERRPPFLHARRWHHLVKKSHNVGLILDFLHTAFLTVQHQMMPPCRHDNHPCRNLHKLFSAESSKRVNAADKTGNRLGSSLPLGPSRFP